MDIREKARVGVSEWFRKKIDQVMFVNLAYKSVTGKDVMRDIQPCPKCGEDKLYDRVVWDNEEGWFSGFQVTGPVRVQLKCLSCGYKTKWDFDDAVVTKEWNGGWVNKTMDEYEAEIKEALATQGA